MMRPADQAPVAMRPAARGMFRTAIADLIVAAEWAVIGTAVVVMILIGVFA